MYIVQHSKKPLDHLKKIVSTLYWPKAINVHSFRDARRHLCKKLSYQSEILPPTSGAFKQAILRAHRQARTWYLSDKCSRRLPNPLPSGWEEEAGSYIPITTENPIARDAVHNLIKCGCKGDFQTEIKMFQE